MNADTDNPSAKLKAELDQVKKEVPTIEDVKLIAAVPALVRAEIKKTEHRQLAVTCMFQPSYPDVPLVTELKSKTLADKLLDGLAKMCDAEATKLVGKPQAVHIIRYVKTFIEENLLCVCSEEISAVKRQLTGDSDEMKLKQKLSQIIMKIYQEQYYVHLRISVPEDYPLHQVIPEITETNFPDFLRINFQAQAVEIARQCVHPPLKKNPKDPPFVLKPSLQPVCEFLIEHIKKYPLEVCPLCHERVLPVDPKCWNGIRGDCVLLPSHKRGKLCPACGKQIFHDKWKVSADVMEKRWAHKQAKQRELEEVVDFLE